MDRRTTTTVFSLALALFLLSLSVVPAGAGAAEPQEKGKSTLAASPYLRPLAPGSSGAPAFDGKFSIDRDQTIAILGGTNALEMQRSGYLEAQLAIAYPEHQLRVRNMAWQADTVYRQQRPRHFFQPAPIRYPGDTDGRKPVPVDTIIFWMGQSESLEGLDRLDAFRDAYSAMLDQLSTITPRIVLVTPVPFEKTKAVPLDVESRNNTLSAYAAAIIKIGEERKFPVVDLFISVPNSSKGESFTRNGMHLNTQGCFVAAREFERFKQLSDVLIAEGNLQPPLAEVLRQQVIKKNDLWYRHWRPTNWAFLYGNRSLQPSSRDHIDNKKRWFPKEIASILPLVEKLDGQIHDTAKKIAEKLK